MLRRLETMVLMTGYELPLRAIREQIASAVDLIVHTARLKDGSRKIVNITEVYGIEDDEILTQDIFAFEQTGIRDGKVEGDAQADRHPADVHGAVQGRRDRAAARRVRHPADDPSKPEHRPPGQGSLGRPARPSRPIDVSARPSATAGRSPPAAWSTSRRSVRSIRTPARSSAARSRSRRASACENLKARLEAAGSSLDKVVWANWSLRDPTEFDTFNEEWAALVPGRRADRSGHADAARCSAAPASGSRSASSPRPDRDRRRVRWAAGGE